MPFTTSHCESGEGARGVKAALDRTLEWLKAAEPGNAPVRWRITMSFKETDDQNADNEGARRTGKLPFLDSPEDQAGARSKPRRGRPRKDANSDDPDVRPTELRE
jgi:hypothetical protein